MVFIITIEFVNYFITFLSRIDYTSNFGFIDEYIGSLTNYVYRKGWSQKSIFGKLVTLILLPFAVCISAIQIAFTILRWLLIATVVLVVLYVFYIGIFS